MTKILEVDDVEIEFEKQHPEVSCKWCLYLKVRKKNHDKLLLMIKTNEKPKTRFTVNNGDTVTLMDKKQKTDLVETLKDVSDLDKSISRAYDVLLGSKPATVLIEDEEMDTSIGGNVTMRGSFLIDEEGVIRHAVLNDLPLGRNIDEMLRMVDALTFHTENGDVCPANWETGKTAMQASDEGMRKFMAEEANNL